MLLGPTLVVEGRGYDSMPGNTENCEIRCVLSCWIVLSCVVAWVAWFMLIVLSCTNHCYLHWYHFSNPAWLLWHWVKKVKHSMPLDYWLHIVMKRASDRANTFVWRLLICFKEILFLIMIRVTARQHMQMCFDIIMVVMAVMAVRVIFSGSGRPRMSTQSPDLIFSTISVLHDQVGECLAP